MEPKVEDQSQKESARQNQWVDYLAKGGLILGVTLVTGLLAAIGIDKDLFARLLRNDPAALRWAMWAAILGVATPIIGYLFATARAWRSNETTATGEPPHAAFWKSLNDWSRNPNRIRNTTATLGAIFLTIAAMITVYHGIESFGDREHPTLQAVATRSGTNDEVRVTATGQSLKTSEHMYMRIIVFDAWHAGEVDKACSNSLTEVPDGARVLFWGQSGPADLKGMATAETDVNVNKEEFPFLCAHAIITDPKRVTISTAAPSAYPGAAACPPVPPTHESADSASSTGPLSTAGTTQPTTCSQVAPSRVVSRQGDRYSSLFMDLRNMGAPDAPTESPRANNSGTGE